MGATTSERWQPSSTLPPLYAPWIGDLLGGPLPSETQATCQSCVMLPGDRPTAAGGLFFSPETKCCTYIPALPNYLVGRILDDTDPAFATGRASVERRIDDRIGVTPLGLAAPPLEALLYRSGGKAAFGRNRRLRCPHYLDDGGCGIWRHRNGVCSTWFCKHERGGMGQRFWHALDDLLATVESQLARWCLLRLEIDGHVLARVLPARPGRARQDTDSIDGPGIDGRINDATYRSLWSAWHGRERELYRETARLVAELQWSDVTRIAGANSEALARIVTSSYRSLGDAIPERLVVGALTVMPAGRDHVSVTAYSGSDPLDLPRILMDALTYFDGRPTASVLRQIRAEKRVNLQIGLIRRLVDFGILVDADGQPSQPRE